MWLGKWVQSKGGGKGGNLEYNISIKKEEVADGDDESSHYVLAVMLVQNVSIAKCSEDQQLTSEAPVDEYLSKNLFIKINFLIKQYGVTKFSKNNGYVR